MAAVFAVATSIWHRGQLVLAVLGSLLQPQVLGAGHRLVNKVILRMRPRFAFDLAGIAKGRRLVRISEPVGVTDVDLLDKGLPRQTQFGLGGVVWARRTRFGQANLTDIRMAQLQASDKSAFRTTQLARGGSRFACCVLAEVGPVSEILDAQFGLPRGLVAGPLHHHGFAEGD